MYNKLIAITALSLIIGFGACKKKEPCPAPVATETGVALKLQFNPKFGGDYNWSNQYTNSSNDTFSFDKVKFILSNFILEKTNGDKVELNAFAYISLKNGPSNVQFVNVPKGDYQSIRFNIGLDSAINHGDPLQWGNDHPLSPSLNDMHWGWAGGYIFNVVEGSFMNNGMSTPFSYHIATAKYKRTHSFVMNFSLASNANAIFDVNLDKYFDNVVAFSIKNDGKVSHSGDVDPIMDKFIQNTLGLFELVSVE